MRMRFFVVSILAALSIMVISTYLKTYNFNKKEWMRYYSKILLEYLLVWNIIVYNLEKYIT